MMIQQFMTDAKRFFSKIFLYKVYGYSSYIYAVFTVVIACSYYHYLDSLYVVDPVFDADSLREYTILEKMTLRVKVDDKLLITPEVKRYIEKYSLCQSVHEIQVLWPSRGPPPPPLSTFTFAHTHSLVNFYTVDNNMLDDSSLLTIDTDIETDGIFILDSSVEISCNDMKYLQSSWRSSQTVAVGLVPRLHSFHSAPATDTIVNDRTMSYLDWYYVWWNGKFSLLLSTAIIIHKSQLKEHFINNAWNKKFLEEHPQCALVTPSFYLSYLNNAAPIWVDISFSRKTKTQSTKSIAFDDLDILPELSGSDLSLSQCLTALTRQYKVEYIPYSNKKSVLAKSQLFW